MATSLHEGPANQLDLLIRAGKKTKKARVLPRQRGFVWAAAEQCSRHSAVIREVVL